MSAIPRPGGWKHPGARKGTGRERQRRGDHGQPGPLVWSRRQEPGGTGPNRPVLGDRGRPAGGRQEFGRKGLRLELAGNAGSTSGRWRRGDEGPDPGDLTAGALNGSSTPTLKLPGPRQKPGRKKEAGRAAGGAPADCGGRETSAPPPPPLRWSSPSSPPAPAQAAGKTRPPAGSCRPFWGQKLVLLFPSAGANHPHPPSPRGWWFPVCSPRFEGAPDAPR